VEPRAKAPQPKVAVPRTKITVVLMWVFRLITAIAKFKNNCKRFWYRNCTMHYSISRTGDNETRYYCRIWDWHPWMMHKQLATPMFRWQAAVHVALMNHVQVKFKFEVIDLNEKE
jgi:hypothetical protein